MRTAIFAFALMFWGALVAIPIFAPAPGPSCTAAVLTFADRMGEVCYEFSKNPSGREKDGVTTFARACRREVESYRQQRGGCR